MAEYLSPDEYRKAFNSGGNKYIDQEHLLSYIEETIRENTNWVIFETNGEELWARVLRTIEAILTGLWKDGLLVGASPHQAFFIKVDQSTMTEEDIENGRLICEVGVATEKPEVFAVFHITQNTEDDL